MGAPGYTTFCKNGHIVDSVLHHCISIKEPRKCGYCGSTELVIEMEWGDSDYGTHSIPYEPIGEEWVRVNTEFSRGEFKVSVFDVSKVKSWFKLTQDETRICVNCGEDFILEGGEIDFFNRKKLHLPRRCKACRTGRKNPEKELKEGTRNYV